MTYLKRILQAAFIIAIIWLTYTNADRNVDMVFFTKHVRNAPVVLVIVISLFTGALIASFIAVMREMKTAKLYRETEKENSRLKKELEESLKDIRLNNIDLEQLRIENASFKKMIDVNNQNNPTGVIL